ncbi:hypothetical protein [Pseudomonas syringae group genomosp. 7]
MGGDRASSGRSVRNHTDQEGSYLTAGYGSTGTAGADSSLIAV